MENKKKIPAGIKIVSVIFYAAIIIFSINLILNLISSLSIIAEGTGTFPTHSKILSIGWLIFIIFCVFMASGLWRLKNWARISTIALASILIIIQLYNIYDIVVNKGNQVESIIPIIVIPLQIFIVGYLIFSKKVREAFKENK